MRYSLPRSKPSAKGHPASDQPPCVERWAVLNAANNFLKHADLDPEADLSFEEEENDHVIFFATLECGLLGHPLSLNMQAFQIWYLASHPEQLGENTELVRKPKSGFLGLTTLYRQDRLKAGADFLPQFMPAFDHAASGLTGNAFSKTSDDVLQGSAVYWSDKSGLSIDDAHSALVLLRNDVQELLQDKCLAPRRHFNARLMRLL